MRKLFLLIIFILLFLSGCSFNEINPLPQDYNF